MVTILVLLILRFIVFFPLWVSALITILALFLDALMIWRLIK